MLIELSVELLMVPKRLSLTMSLMMSLMLSLMPMLGMLIWIALAKLILLSDST